METMSLVICSCLSCFIVISILFQFMNERYKSVLEGFIYSLVKWGLTIGISLINLIGNSVLNLFSWIVLVGMCALFLYYEEFAKSIKRIIECEVLLLCMGVCESLGVVLVNCFLDILQIEIHSVVMKSCLEVTFSKVILIFLYYMVIVHLMKNRNFLYTKSQYTINIIVLIYSFINMLVIAKGLANGQESYMLSINMGCIVLADLYLLYFVKIINEKNYIEYQFKALEKQAGIQYEYYVQQEQKYNKTVQILHDVNKHVKSIVQLYESGNMDVANEYIGQVGNMLKPLIPAKYTGNPILDILISDKASIMEEKHIQFEVKVDYSDLAFIDAIDATTIFGNLLDNAIEACDMVRKDKKVAVHIGSYHEMVSISVKNSCAYVKWKNGLPVSEKGKDRGQCHLVYDENY